MGPSWDTDPEKPPLHVCVFSNFGFASLKNGAIAPIPKRLAAAVACRTDAW